MNFIYRVFNFIARLLLSNKRYAKLVGIKFGKDCRFVGNISFGSEPYLVSIGNHVSITKCNLLTHDGAVWLFREKQPDIDVAKPITIGNNVFIGSDCIILPGVNIGDNVIVGAGSVITKNLESGYVYAGVPAKQIKTVDEYYEGIKNLCLPTKNLNQKEKRKYLENNLL
jgi:acetyltransferase-like isoleucine patch superfamily enzyme